VGGFGSAVAEFLGEQHPTKLSRIGVADEFGQSGEPDELIVHYKLGAAAIAERARSMLGV
jgi:transketolase